MLHILGDDYYEVPEVAEMFGVSKQGVYFWIKNRKIRWIRHPISRRYLFPVAEIERRKMAINTQLRAEHIATLAAEEEAKKAIEP